MENEQPQELVELVKRRFKKCGTRSAVEEFKRLHQTGSVEDYMDQFERALSWEKNGHKFQFYFRVIDLGTYDMVLGVKEFAIYLDLP